MKRHENLLPTPNSRDKLGIARPKALRRKDGKFRFDHVPEFVEYILEGGGMEGADEKCKEYAEQLRERYRK